MSKITFDEWKKKYKPINMWNIDIKKYLEEHPDTGWTEYSCDGSDWIESGFGYVNSIQYLLTEIPYEEQIHVTIDSVYDEP
jgi:hypothetical protein